VDDPAARARLDRILELELAEPGAWSLESDGSYTRSLESDGSYTRRPAAS